MSKPRFYFAQSARGPAIFHDPGENCLKFPVLLVSEDLSDTEETGKKVAEVLNAHWKDD